MATRATGPNRDDVRTTVWWTSGIALLAGIWLILAPFLLGYSDVSQNAQWNDVIVGIAIAVVAAIRLANPVSTGGLSWVNVALGIWLIAAPFLLGYSEIDEAMWNDIIVGAIVVIVSAISAMAAQSARTTADTTVRT